MAANATKVAVEVNWNYSFEWQTSFSNSYDILILLFDQQKFLELYYCESG